MANLGKRWAKLPNNERVELKLYYIKGAKSYDKSLFFVTPVKQEYILPDYDELVNMRVGSEYYRGTTGNTEGEAIEAFEEYLVKFEQAVMKKTAVIFVKIDDAISNSWHRDKGQRTIDVRINFEYQVGFYMEFDGQKRYYKDKVYHRESRDEHEYNAEKNWTIIPFTPEALAKCEEITKHFITMNNKLKKLFGSKKSATEVLLSKNTNLLMYGTDQPKPEAAVPGQSRNDQE